MSKKILNGLLLGESGGSVLYGTGSPEGVQTANPGSVYLDANGKWWGKATGTGNTGWITTSPLPMGYPPKSGNYLNPANMIATAATTIATGNMSACPVDVGPMTQAFNQIALVTGTAQSGGSTTMRLGIYADDGSGGHPGALVLDAGVVTALSPATSIVGITISQSLQPGRYWLVAKYVVATTPTTAATIQQISTAIIIWGPTITNSAYKGLLVTGQTAGALAGTAPSMTPSSGSIITMGLKAA